MEKKFKWKDMLALCNSLSEEQLNEEVRYWGDEQSFDVKIHQLEEQYFWDDYNYSPASSFDNLEEDCPNLEDNIAKGTPVFIITELKSITE